VPRLGVEPGHRSLLDELPNVHVHTKLDLEAWLRNLAGNIRDAQRSNPELRRTVRKLTGGHATEQSKLEALWGWVVEHVEDGGDLSSSATATLASRTGNRMMLLRVMLREAGVTSQLWLARDKYGPAPLPGGDPMVELFDAVMLRVQPKGENPLMVMTASKVLPLGYLTPGYAGAPGLRVPLSPKDPATVANLPQPPAHLADQRHWALHMELDQNGAGTVKGTVTLRGMEAVTWRQALRELDRDRIPEVFQQAELGWLRGSTVSSVSIVGERDLDAPLQLKFTATAEGIGVMQGGALVLQSSPMPLNPAARYTALPSRTTGLVIPYAPRQGADIEFILRGATFTVVPEAQTVASKFGTFERQVTQGGPGKDRVVLKLRSELRTGIVEPGAYESLAAFARQVETAMGAPLRVESGKVRRARK
jgi:hypothetical protein